MAVTLNYPSPTAMGVGRLVIDNGDNQGAPHVRFDDLRPPSQPEPPRPETKMAFAIPKAPALSLNNGDAFEAIRLKDMG